MAGLKKTTGVLGSFGLNTTPDPDHAQVVWLASIQQKGEFFWVPSQVRRSAQVYAWSEPETSALVMEGLNDTPSPDHAVLVHLAAVRETAGGTALMHRDALGYARSSQRPQKSDARLGV